MMPHERRLNIRKPLEHLVYLSLPSHNGGVVLDVSEGGVGFHAVAPVEADGPIRFRFAIDSSARITAVGELAWKDETGKICGLRFTELPDEVREQIRVWAGESEATALDNPVAEPVIEPEAAPSSNAELAPLVAAGNPHLYSLKPPVYGAPFNKLSMFPLELDFRAGATAAVVPQFVQMLDGIAEQIRIWVAQSKSSVHDNPFADPAFETEVTPRSETELAPVVDIPLAEPAIEFEAAHISKVDLVPDVATRNQLNYNLKPPIYSGPSNKLSMFPLELNSEAGATAVALPQSVVVKHPFAAVGLTVALAFLVSMGICVYASTTRAGDVVFDWGEKMWGGYYSQPIPRDLVPPARSAPDSSKSTQR
jgi:hypothetical protein